MRITQSAMSNALARLRDYFGDELLVKVGRGLEPTARALALAAPVREVLTRVDGTIAAERDFDPARSDRVFNLLVSDYTLATLAPELLRLSAALAPGVRFNFLQQVSTRERLLDHGDVDLLIIPGDFCLQRHPSELLLEETFCAICCANGPHARRKLTQRSFAQAGHVVMMTSGGAPSLESIVFERRSLLRWRRRLSRCSSGTSAPAPNPPACRPTFYVHLLRRRADRGRGAAQGFGRPWARRRCKRAKRTSSSPAPGRGSGGN
jgi:DNA-binding transcriptional LysR family regulator